MPIYTHKSLLRDDKICFRNQVNSLSVAVFLVLFITGAFLVGCTTSTKTTVDLQSSSTDSELSNQPSLEKATIASVIGDDASPTSVNTPVSTAPSNNIVTPAKTKKNVTANFPKTITPLLKITNNPPQTLVPTSITPEPSESSPTPLVELITIPVTPAIKDDLCIENQNLSESSVTVTFSPFCIKWLDKYPDEKSFQVLLSYFNVPEQYIFEVAKDSTYLVVPNDIFVVPSESFEQCMRQKDIFVEVFALIGNRQEIVGKTMITLECNINDY